jgi:MFS family permease
MVGALCSSWFSDRFGRRWAFRIAAVGFIFGTIVQSGASGFAGLMFGRTFVGLGVGFGLAVDPVYIGEISQAAHRGQLVTWSEIAVSYSVLSCEVVCFDQGLDISCALYSISHVIYNAFSLRPTWAYV